MPRSIPGTVIGQVFRTATATPRDFPRRPCIIAKGLDIKLFRDAAIVRGEVEAETLPFSGTTYTAPLQHTAIPDQKRARLYTAEGRTISPARWRFVESEPGVSGVDSVIIESTFFSTLTTYLFDYVSDDPTIRDVSPVDDLQEVLAVGDNRGQVLYREGIDYMLTATVTAPTPGAENTHASDSELVPAEGEEAVPVGTLTGNGTVTINEGSTYTHQYNRAYRVRVVRVAAPNTATTPLVRVEAFPTSSGSSTVPPRIASPTAPNEYPDATPTRNEILIDLSSGGPEDREVELGISLDFDGTFALGDTYTFQAVGPALLELSDQLTNENQFAQTSAMEVTATGEGSLAVSPQSSYTGQTNRTYEITCVDVPAAGDASEREATFRWTTNPLLKLVTGTVTATSGSNTVTGLSTQFVSDISSGDYLFIGANPAPVRVTSVTNATTLVLSANYPYATQNGVKVLRLREVTGEFTVGPVGDQPMVRKALGDGLFIDADFGGDLVTDNFVEGDRFSFTANVGRVPFNGKENRNYDFTVTQAVGVGAPAHQVTVTYTGSTAASGFGSFTFGEGQPLLLANNVALHARNVSLSNRFDESNPSPDTFETSLTFDGAFDWTLEAETTETVPTADFLRDLTGRTTGQVGAYFFRLAKQPTEILYVRGPAPSYENVTYNQVPGTTLLYFTTNPGVNLTVRYRYAGSEPKAGSTYYLSGYAKRPDSDYELPQLFSTRDEARAFLAPMTPLNDAAIANEIAWDQDAAAMPGIVICLVRDSDGDGVYSSSDYRTAISVAEAFEGTVDAVVVNQFQVRGDFRDSVVNQNDPNVARRRIGYFGFPINLPIGDEFTADSRIFTARRELQVFEQTVSRGALAVIGNSYAKKTILVDSLGDGNIDTIPTQVTLDGSFLAVALAARVSSFTEPYEVIYNLPVSGFDEIETLTVTQMSDLQSSGIICLRVDGNTAVYIGTMTTDTTEPSTQQLSGTVQRQYVLARLQDTINRTVIGYVADSPEDAAQKLAGEITSELGAMVSEKKIAPYVNAAGQRRELDPSEDVIALRDPGDPTRAYFRAHWFQRYPLLEVEGVVAVDGPRP